MWRLLIGLKLGSVLIGSDLQSDPLNNPSILKMPDINECVHVVVAGASFAALAFVRNFARSLRPASIKMRLTLIADRDYAHNPIAAPRAVCCSTTDEQAAVWLDRVLAPLKPDLLIGAGAKAPVEIRLVLGRLSGWDANENKVSVNTHTGGETTTTTTTTIAYDYLVLATGSSYARPSKLHARTLQAGREELRACQLAIKKAESVLVIGGGPVGCELAGELAYHHPGKRVTLLHAGVYLYIVTSL